MSVGNFIFPLPGVRVCIGATAQPAYIYIHPRSDKSLWRPSLSFSVRQRFIYRGMAIIIFCAPRSLSKCAAAAAVEKRES